MTKTAEKKGFLAQNNMLQMSIEQPEELATSMGFVPIPYDNKEDDMDFSDGDAPNHTNLHDVQQKPIEFFDYNDYNHDYNESFRNESSQYNQKPCPTNAFFVPQNTFPQPSVPYQRDLYIPPDTYEDYSEVPNRPPTQEKISLLKRYNCVPTPPENKPLEDIPQIGLLDLLNNISESDECEPLSHERTPLEMHEHELEKIAKEESELKKTCLLCSNQYHTWLARYKNHPNQEQFLRHRKEWITFVECSELKRLSLSQKKQKLIDTIDSLKLQSLKSKLLEKLDVETEKIVEREKVRETDDSKTYSNNSYQQRARYSSNPNNRNFNNSRPYSNVSQKRIDERGTYSRHSNTNQDFRPNWTNSQSYSASTGGPSRRSNGYVSKWSPETRDRSNERTNEDRPYSRYNSKDSESRGSRESNSDQRKAESSSREYGCSSSSANNSSSLTYSDDPSLDKLSSAPSSKKGGERSPSDHPVSTPKSITTVDELITWPGRQNRPEKILIILRGLPGSGKSTFAQIVCGIESAANAPSPRLLTSASNTETSEEIAELFNIFSDEVKKEEHNFYIIDLVNEKVSNFNRFYYMSMHYNFEVYIVEFSHDPVACNTISEGRYSVEELTKIASTWEDTPSKYTILSPASVMLKVRQSMSDE